MQFPAARSRSPHERSALYAATRRAASSGSGERPPGLETEAARQAALEDIDRGLYAESSAPAVRARRNAYRSLLEVWGFRPFPVTAHSLRCLAASLKAGRYRSFASILSQLKVDSERKGQTWDGSLRRLYADASRSCGRGLGPSVQAMPLPFERLQELPADPRPWVTGGPVGSRNAIIMGTWFMMREVELSTLRGQLVTMDLAEVPAVSVQLPATKSDTAALGVTRAHACICGIGVARPQCPVHSAWGQHLVLQHAFGRTFAVRPGTPFFPTLRGGVVTKRAMTETIVFAASVLGMNLVSPDRSLRVSGHSLRPTWPQGLSKVGLDIFAIELLGRLGGSTVRRYFREAAVSIAAARARSAAMATSLDELRRLGRSTLSSTGGQPTSEQILTLLQEHVPCYLASWRATLLE